MVAGGVPKPPPFLSPYQLRGDTLYISGNCGVDPSTGKFLEGNVKDRTAQIIRNIEAACKANDMQLSDVVSCTIYLSKYTEDFAAMNEAYTAGFPTGMSMPSRTCIGVAALPQGTDVEISAIAVKSK